MVGCSIGEAVHGVFEAAASAEKLVQARRSSRGIVSASLPTTRKLSFGFLSFNVGGPRAAEPRRASLAYI